MHSNIAALSAASILFAVSGLASAGVVHRVTLGGEITEVGPIAGSLFDQHDVNPRSAERWSIVVDLDAAAPDLAGPDLTAYGSSITSASIVLDDHAMDLDFGAPGGGIRVASAAAGRVAFDSVLMGSLDVSVLAEGIGVSPTSGLPSALDVTTASLARFTVVDDQGVTLVAGTFDGYTFETILPAPGAAATLALGGLVASRRRR